MTSFKKRATAIVMLTLLATPVATTPFLQAPSVLAQESNKESIKKVEDESSFADAIAEESNSEEGDGISKVVEKEATILADSSVFYIQVGYEFDDGSFDEWAKGTAFLASDQELVTIQTLADRSTDSTLYKAVLDKKGDAYKTAGIDLKDEEEVEKHFVIRVTNTDGDIIAVKDSTAKNGLGLISLEKKVSSSPAIFAEEEDVDSKEGTKYKFKISALSGDKAAITEVEGSLVKPAASAAKGTLAMKADSSAGEVLGAPIYNANGNIVGMVSNKGDDLTVIPTVGIQTFLTNNGVKFDTRTTAEKKQEAEAKAAQEEALKEAELASVSTKKLEKAIKAAQGINKKDYKEDSYKVFAAALKDAKKVLNSEDKSQAEVDSAQKTLEKSQANLEKYTLMDKMLVPALVGIGVIGVAVASAIFMAKRKSSRHLPKPKGDKPVAMPNDDSDFSSELRRMDQEDLMKSHPAQPAPTYQEPVMQRKNDAGIYEDLDYGLDLTDRVAPASLRTGSTDVPGVTFADESPERPTNLAGQKFGVPLGGAGLMDDGEEETTILGKTAYLIREADGTEIPLRNGFIIGKERRRVHYCITGNPSISRTHAQFVEHDGKYYVEDLESKNYTFLNGVQLPAYRAALLSDGDIIRMSDVEFIFHD